MIKYGNKFIIMLQRIVRSIKEKECDERNKLALKDIDEMNKKIKDINIFQYHENELIL